MTDETPDDPPAPSFPARYAMLFGGEAVSKLCVMGAFAYLAHVLTPAEYGVVELALSITLFFVLSVESGMGLYGAGAIAARPGRLPALLPHIMVLRVALGVPLFALLLAGARRFAPEGYPLLAVNGIAVLLTPFLIQWVFQGLRQMQWVALGSVIRNLTFVILVLVLVRPGVDIRLVAAAEVGGIAGLALFNLFILRTRVRTRIDWRVTASGLQDLFSRVWFMGLGDLTWACTWYGPAVILWWLAQPEQVAWMTASVRVVVALHTFVWLYFFNLLPNLSRDLATGVDRWRDLVVRSLGTALWPAFFIAIVGTLGAPVLMPLAFGADYVWAVVPVQIAIWMIPITWFSGHFRFSLIAAGRQRTEVTISAVSAVIAIVVALAGGRALGARGAALALVIAGLANAAIAWAAASRQIGGVPVRPAFGLVSIVTAASLVLGFGAAQVAGSWIGTALASAAFVGVALTYNNELLRTLRGVVAGR